MYLFLNIFSGKIPYYTVPPEEEVEQSTYKIVSEIGKEFDIDSIETMETDILDKIKQDSESGSKSFVLDSLGPVDATAEEMEQDNEDDQLVSIYFVILCTFFPL